jgi:nucleoside-diphosphate-sugar epimerase
VNIGSGRPVTFLDLARLMVDVEGYAAEVKGKEGMPVGVAARYCDPAHMFEVLDWAPSISLEDGVRRGLAFAKKRLSAGIRPED